MKTPCPHHTPFSHKYYFNEKVEKMIMDKREQRQCPDCLFWFFHGEFGKGWKAGRRETEEITEKYLNQ